MSKKSNKIVLEKEDVEKIQGIILDQKTFYSHFKKKNYLPWKLVSEIVLEEGKLQALYNRLEKAIKKRLKNC